MNAPRQHPAGSATVARVAYRTVKVDGLDIFYREAGPEGRPDDPALARLPDSLADVPQPDPGPGGRYPPRRPGLPRLRPQLDAPSVKEFDYTFDHLAEVVENSPSGRPDEVQPLCPGLRRPVGYRLAVKHPERVQAILCRTATPTTRAWTTTSGCR